MISKLTSILLFTVCSLTLHAQNIARVENIKIQSKALDQEREILIYTPLDYDWRMHEYFNVIYVFDAHHRELFDYTTSILSFISENSKNFIVVGITSPYIKETDYSRNNDLLPVLNSEAAQKRYGKYSGNADNFYEYVKDEVIPYVEANYRTLNSVGIGHSLSASFILSSMVKTPTIFDNYIAISPNFAYDNERVAEEILQFDYSKFTKPTLVYISHADEGNGYWKEWKPSREKVYSFLQSKDNDNLIFEKGNFEEYNHWTTFPVSLNKALPIYIDKTLPLQESILSQEEYEVTINVSVPNKKDVLYITGNQDKLANWNPKKIKMKKLSDYERTITLKLKSPTQFKLTKGNWDTEAEVEGSFGNIIIKPETQSTFNLKVLSFYD
ncbi:alpha/beta hydrolase-fold protein [Flammeovirga agarivorans]|uniref:Esterase n=1 Tax=Flammeovirga agarivorans TaxID=2726742 RepID=A0A7X8SQR1_9BACT|nr:alpha/beta hydrolase-fold protein [Flammeovirga agarivorans]NLR94630.1 esterase [Flammeovirga agarivorans]